MTWKAIADNPADTDNILDIAFQNSVENWAYPAEMMQTVAIAEAGIKSTSERSCEYPNDDTRNPPKL
jgi:hypothetical protein